MSLARKIQELPTWGQNLLAILLGTILSVCFPTADSATDAFLGGGLILVRTFLYKWKYFHFSFGRMAISTGVSSFSPLCFSARFLFYTIVSKKRNSKSCFSFHFVSFKVKTIKAKLWVFMHLHLFLFSLSTMHCTIKHVSAWNRKNWFGTISKVRLKEFLWMIHNHTRFKTMKKLCCGLPETKPWSWRASVFYTFATHWLLLSKPVHLKYRLVTASICLMGDQAFQ